jgi:hypothetical protein
MSYRREIVQTCIVVFMLLMVGVIVFVIVQSIEFAR